MSKYKKPKSNKITSFDLKLALLEYFRFTRQWICVDECLHADIIADTGKQIIEVEVKISKYDLLRGEEKKKWKHDNYGRNLYGPFVPNKYYFCVLVSLQEIAIRHAHHLNPRYGVIVFDPEQRNLLIVKSARTLHDKYNEKHRHQIAKRASCKLITLMQKGCKP